MSFQAEHVIAIGWIVVFPGALICSYLAYLVGGTINNVTTAMFLEEPLTGWIKVVLDAMAHMYMGAAFTYSAIKIAPRAPKHVASGAFALLVVFSACLFGPHSQSGSIMRSQQSPAYYLAAR